MASIKTPVILAFTAGGTIVKGHAVKLSDKATVVECTAATDKAIGVAHESASSGQTLGVCMPGGGAFGVAQTTITVGALVVPHTDGTIKPIAAAGNRIIGVAMDAAAAGDIFSMEVQVGQAYATE